MFCAGLDLSKGFVHIAHLPADRITGPAVWKVSCILQESDLIKASKGSKQAQQAQHEQHSVRMLAANLDLAARYSTTVPGCNCFCILAHDKMSVLRLVTNQLIYAQRGQNLHQSGKMLLLVFSKCCHLP